MHVIWRDTTPRQGQGETILERHLQTNGEWSDIEDLAPNLEFVGEPYLVASLARELCLLLDTVTGVYTRAWRTVTGCLSSNPPRRA